METPTFQFSPEKWPIPKFRPIGPLGAGGFAEVWEAESDQGDRVALKIFRAPDLSTQVLREAKAAVGMLSHSNLVSIREYHPGGGGTPPYIAMELVPGKSLEDLISQGEITGERTGKLAKQIMEKASAGMIGVNIGVPVPREPFSFGGWNESKFGVGDITGRSSIEFWTQNKKTTIKWNPGAKTNWMS